MPKGARCLDDWAQVLSVCTRLLHDHADRELQIAAARAVAAILNYHYHPDLGGLLFAVPAATSSTLTSTGGPASIASRLSPR